jgi:hypothetical protein
MDRVFLAWNHAPARLTSASNLSFGDIDDLAFVVAVLAQAENSKVNAAVPAAIQAVCFNLLSVVITILSWRLAGLPRRSAFP